MLFLEVRERELPFVFSHGVLELLEFDNFFERHMNGSNYVMADTHAKYHLMPLWWKPVNSPSINWGPDTAPTQRSEPHLRAGNRHLRRADAPSLWATPSESGLHGVY